MFTVTDIIIDTTRRTIPLLRFDYIILQLLFLENTTCSSRIIIVTRRVVIIRSIKISSRVYVRTEIKRELIRRFYNAIIQQKTKFHIWVKLYRANVYNNTLIVTIPRAHYATCREPYSNLREIRLQ